MTGLLTGRTILISGVLTRTSIAYEVAQLAQREGATVLLTGFGRRRRITETTARSLEPVPPILEFDAEQESHVSALATELRSHTDRLDGVVHCISGSHPSVAGEHFLTADWNDVAHSMRVSAYSYQSLIQACLPILSDGASIVGCTLDASVAWPVYGWAGVAKSAYESINRYLAHHLGPRRIRVNLVAAGPVRSATMRAIEGIDGIEDIWDSRAPLGWTDEDRTSVSTTITTLLTDLLPGVTGEIIHCDGGFHARGY